MSGEIAGKGEPLHRLSSPIRADVTASSWRLPLQLGRPHCLLEASTPAGVRPSCPRLEKRFQTGDARPRGPSAQPAPLGASWALGSLPAEPQAEAAGRAP